MNYNPGDNHLTRIEKALDEISKKSASTINGGVALLAGNPALKCTRKYGHTYEMELQEQPDAFEGALFAAQHFIRKKETPAASISILFDHLKPWRIFLRHGTREKIDPAAIIVMSDLRDEILSRYCPVIKKYNFSPTDIQVIFEDQCRDQARVWLEKMRESDQDFKMATMPALYQALVKTVTTKMNGCHNLEERISCKGVAGQCIINTSKFAQFASDKPGIFIGIWEEDPLRCDHNFITGGKEIAQKLWGVKEDIHNLILRKSNCRESTSYNFKITN